MPLRTASACEEHVNPARSHPGPRETPLVGQRVRYARSGDVSIAYIDFAGGPADVVFVTGSRRTSPTPS